MSGRTAAVRDPGTDGRAGSAAADLAVPSMSPQDADAIAGGGSRSDATSIAALLVGLLSLAGFVLLTLIVAARVTLPFDQPILDVARSWDGWPVVWEAISQSANIPLIVIGLALVAWLFLTRRRREALLVLVLLAAVTAGSEGVKQLVARPRPSGSGDGIPGVVYSFPSGHTLEALTILGLVAIGSWRSRRGLPVRLAVVVVVAIEVVLVGIARLALNAHYPSDVLAGLLAGIGALGLYVWMTRPGAWAGRNVAGSADDRSRTGRSLRGHSADLRQRQVLGDREVHAGVARVGGRGPDGSFQADARGTAIEGQEREHVAEVGP